MNLSFKNKWKSICQKLSVGEQVDFVLDVIILNKYNPNKYTLYYVASLVVIVIVSIWLPSFIKAVLVVSWFIVLALQLILYFDMLFKFKKKWGEY